MPEGPVLRSIPLYKAHVPPGIGQELEPLFASGQLAGGPAVEAFQESLGEFLGNPRVLLTGDVSSSISLALMLAGVQPEDEVVMSPLVCLATSCPVANQFARIKWCDVDPETGNLDPDSLKQSLTSQTRAIIVYHWAGNPADMDAILAVARERGVPVIEDAGEALGAEYKGRKIGAIGSDYSVFSFYPNRHITTIEGGAIAFKDEATWERGRWLRRYGIHQPSFRLPNGEINPDSDIRQAGLNTYMNHVSAFIGLKQMERLPEILERYRSNASYYNSRFHDHKQIRPLQVLEVADPTHWIYTILVDRRDELMIYLKSHGIQSSRVHIRNDIYTCFGLSDHPLPGVDKFSRQALGIPCGWWVDLEDIRYICERVEAFFSRGLISN